MNIAEFLATIYLGDRALKSIQIDCWQSEVKLQVSCISRVRSDSWDFYADEDLPNGYLVFGGVSRLIHDPRGLVPNDVINEIRADVIDAGTGEHLVAIHVDSVDGNGNRKEVLMQIFARSMALEACDKPGQRITA